MRNALAVALGCVAGFGVPWIREGVVEPFVASAAATLAHGTSRGMGAIGVPAVVVGVTAALVAALALPGLLLSIAEAMHADRPARRAATIVLCALSLGALLCTQVAVGPFVAGCLLMAALIALAPGAWARVPLSLMFGAVAGAWLTQALGTREWVHDPVTHIVELAGGPIGTWTLVVCALQGLLLAGCLVRAMTGRVSS